jgi:hypothetical protein
MYTSNPLYTADLSVYSSHMITKERIQELIDIAEERRNRCEPQSISWYFYEGQIAGYSDIFVRLDD